MSKKYIFAMIGGDHRQSIIAENLLLRGHSVKLFGVDVTSSLSKSGAELVSTLDKAIDGCDAVLLPLPVTKDNVNLNLFTGVKGEQLSISDMLRICEKKLLIGGMIPNNFYDCAAEHSIEVIDFYSEEELQRKNAVPSAEGAIMLAMENTDTVIEGMSVLIGGYGRIGKIIAEKMSALAARVAVAARRDEVLCEIAMRGFDPIRITDIDQMCNAVEKSDVIFNTVPKIVFTKQIIDNCSKLPLYIEVASLPGGIDICSARTEGQRIIFAPSLPGKYAPSSAGKYIFETISNILSQRGMEI